MSVESITSDALAKMIGDQCGVGNGRTILESFGFFLEKYVIQGAEITLDQRNPRRFTLSEAIISIDDGLYRVSTETLTIKGRGTTYFVDFTVKNGFVVNVQHPSGSFLALWEINTNATGNIVSVVDMRGEMGAIRFKEDMLGIIADQIIVDEPHIMNQAVGTTKIKDLAVTTDKYADKSITKEKIAPSYNASDLPYQGSVVGVQKTNEAIDKLKTVLDAAIISGDSGPEAAAARISVSGVTYPTLGDRVDNEYTFTQQRINDNGSLINEYQEQAKAKFSTSSIGVFSTQIRESELDSIKNLGCNYVLWVCYETDINIIKDRVEVCRRNGLNVLLSVSQRFHSGTQDQMAIDMINATKNMDNIVGYYVLDEPDLNAISITRQEEVLSKVKALTPLPVFISTTIVSSDVRVSNKFDYYFIDSYFNNDNYTDIQNGIMSVFELSSGRMLSVAGYVGIEKCIPCVGFFTDLDKFNVRDQDFLFLSNKKTIELYKNNGYIMFMWGDAQGDTLRTNQEFYNNALRLSKVNGMMSRNSVTAYHTGLLSESNASKTNKLMSIYSPLSNNISWGFSASHMWGTGFYFQEGSKLIIDLGKVAENVYISINMIEGKGLGVKFRLYGGINGDEPLIYQSSLSTENRSLIIKGIKSKFLRIETTGLEGTGSTHQNGVAVRYLSFIAQ